MKARDAELTKPAGSLGRLEEIAEWLAAWSGKAPPKITRPMVGIFATAHGVADEGVSAFPSAVNRQMVENFAAGGAAINQICRAYDIGLKVFDLAVDMPTPSITREDAMDEANCAATMAYGMEALAGGIDLICLGEMGIGNTTVAAAVINALFGGKAEDWIGRGTGVDDEGLARKRDAVEKAVARLNGERDPLEILRRIGGREIAAMTGLIIAARLQRVPVIVDGFVTTAAAAVVYAMDPAGLDHCLFAHVSAEQAHAKVLEHMGKDALLDFWHASGGRLRCCARCRYCQGSRRNALRHGHLCGRRCVRKRRLKLFQELKRPETADADQADLALPDGTPLSLSFGSTQMTSGE